MGRFITGHANIVQTDKRRIWKLLENILYEDDNGTVYIVPRNFQSDLYTIPLWIDGLVGGQSEYDVRCCLLHDLFCSTISKVIVIPTLKQLEQAGILKQTEEGWICKDIPMEYLDVKKVSKLEANNIFYRCMKAVGIPKLSRIKIRLGVCFNIGFYLNQLFGKTRKVNLRRFYEADFWDFVGR